MCPVTNYDNNDTRIVDDDGDVASVVDGKLQTDATVTVTTAPITAKHSNNFYPAPDMFYSPADAGEQDNVRLDSDGNLVTRGPCFTDEGSFRDDFSGSSLSQDLTGTCSFENGSYTVTGSGTSFTTEISLDYHIKLSTDGNEYYAKVMTLVSDTELVLVEPYGGTTGSGTGTRAAWHPIIGTGGSITVGSSELAIASGTTASSTTYVSRDIDYGPMRALCRFKMSQRIANHTAEIGYKDDVSSPEKTAYFYFDGTTNTSVKCIASFSSQATEIETLTVTIPNSGTTAAYHDYYIDIQMDQVAFYIDQTQVALLRNHVPGPYDVMNLFVKSTNGGSSPSTTTTVTVDFLSTININQVEVQNTFNASPVFVASAEDTHYLCGEITTTSTTANQVIISTTVPTGKTLLILGYSVATSNVGGTFKIGRGTTVPAGPGTIDAVVFRTVKTSDWGTGNTSRETEDFGQNPRRIGYSGDTVSITVTPRGATSTVWSATLDYVLR